MALVAFDTVAKWIGLVGGLVGPGLGFYNFLTAKRKERRAGADRAADILYYERARRSGGNGLVPSSVAEQQQLERLADLGLLQRREGFYTFPGMMGAPSRGLADENDGDS